MRGRVSDWHLSQPGFDPSHGKLVCLATLMSSDRTKQICLWMTIYIYIYMDLTLNNLQRCPRGVMVKAMNCGIVVREFVLQSRYYVHFRANTLGKGMNPLILPPAMGK